MIEYVPAAGVEFDTRHEVAWTVEPVDADGVPTAAVEPLELSVQEGEGRLIEDPPGSNRVVFVTGTNAGRSVARVAVTTEAGAVEELYGFNPGQAPVPQAATISSGAFEAPAIKRQV